MVVVLSLLLGVGAWYLLAGRFTQTPDFTNMTQAQAQALASEKGFAITFGGDYSETIPAGQVVRTDPATGERIAWGGSITAFLSKGPERYPVPSLVGRTVDDATKTLTDAHLTLGKVTEVWDEKIEIGRVVDASLASGKLVKPQTSIDINVSKGPAPVKIVSVVGKTFDEAKAYYTNLGLVVARAPEDKFSTKIAAGSVLSQDPKSGTLAKGQTITLTVSKGPELVQIPWVTGSTVKEATDALQAAGFKVSVDYKSKWLNKVTHTSPEQNSMAPKGSTVTIYVA
jgi:serine/threonine-protein kinase